MLIGDGSLPAGLSKLRHDLINPLNVLVGTTSALAHTSLDDTQREWLRLLESTTRRLEEILARINDYGDVPPVDHGERLADLCSIAAARLGKPVDPERLIDTITDVVGGDRAGLRVLLVDDSPEFVVLVRAYLVDHGWIVDVVETGERAVQQASSERYDVVLMDIDLPGLDGATAAHAIRAADLARGASPTPIIGVTAFDRPAEPAAPVRQPARVQR